MFKGVSHKPGNLPVEPSMVFEYCNCVIVVIGPLWK